MNSMYNTFNNFLKQQKRTFTMAELVTEYLAWLEHQGFSSPWIDAYDDVKDAMPSIERAGIIWTLEK